MFIYYLIIVVGFIDLFWKYLKVKNIYMNYMYIELIYFILLIKKKVKVKYDIKIFNELWNEVLIMYDDICIISVKRNI